ncbi:MAG: hypothetical protein HOG03_02275 [Desulfobacula sp.]|jgi:hypothetical protein|uniref:hypothetical protein n=1 Tax=Desulfobacula sp. TaxID=2593537 RepID=UPI001DB69281|nr:hypothetical protein [Desulfobacula sp.]MBT3485782.1 hypothetical protein [Desulfobacula sp.]MBT3803406.1 hypothetical protein [Desulfobacula sp.]MBT4024327.1 hypothetical protein [Desulfobacula sp.]MBT4199638.1 hypothetical protein [Desulfobacula sp.]
MPIIFVESHYPMHKQNEVLETWLGAIQKYPKPEELFTTLIDTAISSDKKGLKVLSAYLINPGKYEEASAYFRKFMTAFFDIEGYVYEFNNWATIEEAMEAIEAPMPDR